MLVNLIMRQVPTEKTLIMSNLIKVHLEYLMYNVAERKKLSIPARPGGTHLCNHRKGGREEGKGGGTETCWGDGSVDLSTYHLSLTA